jgi:uncharacterized protein YceH (UPF0502 family)
MQLNLTAVEARILGALIEKERTTPEYYPLTLNALVAACNQKNNRDPVLQLAVDEVERGLTGLRYEKQLVGSFTGAGARVIKYTHRLDKVLGLETPELAIICDLLLRGPQTPGELRNRTARMHPFASPADVKAVLDGLAARQPDPYVVMLPRAAGTKESRFAHTLGEGPLPEAPAAGEAASAPSARRASGADRLRELEERVARLEEWVAAQQAQNGNEN